MKKAKYAVWVGDSNEIVVPAAKSLESFVRAPIPFSDVNPTKAAYERMLWLHSLQCLLETKLDCVDKEPLDIPLLAKISEKLRNFILEKNNREKIDVEHKKAIWVLRSMIDMCIYKSVCEERERDIFLGPPSEFPTMLECLLLVSPVKPIYDYPLEMLMTALERLNREFNTLRYSVELRHYINCLQFSCAKFIFVDRTDDKLYNHPNYVERVVFKKDNASIEMLRVNSDFLIETERCFYWFQRRFWIRQMFKYAQGGEGDVSDEVLDASCTMILRTVNAFTSATLIEKGLYRSLADWNLAMGEREAFQVLDQFSEPNGSNVLGRFRPSKVQAITRLFEQNVFEVVRQHIASIRKNMASPKFVLDFEMICYKVFEYLFDNKVGVRRSLASFVFMYEDIVVPIERNAFYLLGVPVIVQWFTEWGVFDPVSRCVTPFRSFVMCFAHWIKEVKMCRSKERLALSLKSAGLDEIYNEIYGVQAEDESEDLFLPEHYNGESMVVL